LDSNLVVFVLASDDLNKANMANRELEDAIISLGGRPCTAGSRRVEAMKKASPNSLDLLRKAKKVFDEANLFSPERLI
jgi:FAD/FMN-containing dehydrogenase